MAEITLRDLCRWDRRLHLLPPVGMSLEAALDRPVSWVVSVRATPPLLPALRGDELVVLSRRVIEQIENAQTLSLSGLLSTLANESIAALLTEPGFTEEPLEWLPILTMPAPFPHDAEGTLNRLLTERRAELYRLGNDLSRRLSQAAMDTRGLEGILEVASELSSRSLVMQDSEGNVIAHVGTDQAIPATADELHQVHTAAGPALVSLDASTERLVVPTSAGSTTTYLSMTGPTGTLTEADRLVLSQTAGTAAVVIAQGSTLGARGMRRQAIADLLLGRMTSGTAIDARARGLGIDPAARIAVGLISGGQGNEVAERLADRLLGGLEGAERAEVDGRIAFLLPERVTDQFTQRLTRWSDGASQDGPMLAVSEPVPGIGRTPDALRQSRFALGLLEHGVLTGPAVRCDSLEDFRVFGLLYHLWGNPAVDEFRREVLGELEEYDQRRGTGLIKTLDAYLSSGGSLVEAADSLSIHRNTLSYRINRIAELSGRNLGDPDDRLLLRVALLCRDLAKVSEAS